MTKNKKQPGKLNLNTGNNNRPPESPEETIVRFYDTMANCAIEMAIALNKTAEIQQEILIELTDIKDNLNRKGLQEGWLNEVYIKEREDQQEPPDGEENE